MIHLSQMTDSFISLASFLEKNILDPVLGRAEREFYALCTISFPTFSSVVKNVYQNNESIQAKHLPLMNPFHVVVITLCYLSTVFAGNINHFTKGKYIMSNFVKRKLEVSL